MIGHVVRVSLENRLVVLLAVVILAFVGIRSYLSLPVDAVPDVTNVQVQVLTNAPGLSPLETEQLVSRPVELAMSGMPGARTVRSVSRAGVSAVTIVFQDDVEIATARELVAQRLPAAREAMPPGASRPEMGPLTTGLGEVYHFTLRWPGHSARDVRTLLDWEIAVPLKGVPGVVEVNAWGGELRQIEVRVRTEDLRALHVSLSELEGALRAGGAAVGAGALAQGEEQVLVRLDGQYRSADDVAAQIVRTRPDGTPIVVRDVATVREGAAIRQSAATADGEGETVYAMVQMVAGGNAHEIVAQVKQRLAELERRLPEGVVIEPFYDRAALVDKVLATVRRSLLEGGLVVALVLFAFLGDVMAGLVVASAIPLAMLGAFALMRALGVSGNLMSLGAIDFGLVVDGAVVVVEGALATMTLRRTSARDALEHGGRTIGRPIVFGVLILAIVYVPVLLLEGVEGKMFRPMALTVLFAIGTALVLSFTWIPAAASLLLRKVHAAEPWVVRTIRRGYGPLLEAALARPALALCVSVALVTVGVLAAFGRGAEFVPRLQEGDLVVQVTRPPSVSLEEAIRGSTDMQRALLSFPEVRRVVTRTGSPDVATDIMGLEQSDVFVILAPKNQWTSARTEEELIGKLDEATRKALPGAAFGFTQPIEMRVAELLGGVRSDVGIKIFGDDFSTLRTLVDQVLRTLQSIPGSADVRAEPLEGLAIATVRPRPAGMGRLAVRPDELAMALAIARAGVPAGRLVEGERRFDVVLKLDAPPLPDERSIARMPIVLGDGRAVLVGDVADVTLGDAPAVIGRENAKRRVLVECNVRGRDLASFVGELQSRLDRIERPTGYYFSVTGEYENLVRGAERLALIVPLTLAIIFVLLYLTFHDVKTALLVMSNVPVAASGGVLALAARGLPLSISAAVGMIALFGVATLNGVVLLSAIRQRREEGEALLAAVRDGAHERLRPVLTTAVVAALGFVPMAIATGTGAEVQRPLATVVIGGLGTATLLTLGLLPALYLWIMSPRSTRSAKRA
jgi:cobalt-zinc-cadmium resistance protein CzcA